VGVNAVLALDGALVSLTLLVVVVCGITDALYQKIWNVVTVPAMILGVLLNLSFVFVDARLGLQTVLSSLASLGVGFGIMFVLFHFGGMGGGDVKLVAALGAMDPYHLGAWFSLWLVFYSVMAGGVMSIVVLTLKGKLLRSLRNVFRAAFTYVTPGYEHEPLKPENSDKIPFGLGIAFGTLWVLILIQIGAFPG
jgi:prepilin peptidase CpaA